MFQCSSSLPDFKQQKNIKHGEGLVLKSVLKDLLMQFLEDTENNGLNLDSDWQ